MTQTVVSECCNVPVVHDLMALIEIIQGRAESGHPIYCLTGLTRFTDMTEPRSISAGTTARIRILATTDLHMNLMAYDYYADRPDVSVGLVQTAGVIETARREADQDNILTLLFDNGDSLQGTPMGDLAAKNCEQSHPLMQAFEHLNYDAVGLGNHDFNFGLDTLMATLAQAPCPVLCSNLRRLEGQDISGILPFSVLDRSLHVDGSDYPIRIGVLSFLPPQTVQWDAHHLQNRIAVDDMIYAAPERIRHLKRLGCDIIVALAHSGLDDTPEQPDMENAIIPLAALDGIDAVIAGHTHLLLPGPAHDGLANVNVHTGDVHGKPVVMPGAAGSHVGVIDLRLTITDQGRWAVSGFGCALRPISVRDSTGTLLPTTRPDQALAKILAPIHEATRALMHQSVGYTDVSLHSYFSFIAPDRALAVVAAAQAVALRSILVGTEEGELPLISATAPAKYGARSGPHYFTDIPAGNVSLRHVADLHVFPNELRAVIVTGRQIRCWLEQSSALFQQIDPGSTGTPLTNPSIPGHDFDVLHGLTWQIDLSVNPRVHPGKSISDGPDGRVSDIRLDGELILPGQRFVVALNNYRASGGGDFVALDKTTPVPIPPVSIREIICDYMSDTFAPDPIATAPPAWRFKPMPGTYVTLQTGPGARGYLSELADRNFTVTDPGADGFLYLTLEL